MVESTQKEIEKPTAEVPEEEKDNQEPVALSKAQKKR